MVFCGVQVLQVKTLHAHSAKSCKENTLVVSLMNSPVSNFSASVMKPLDTREAGTNCTLE